MSLVVSPSRARLVAVLVLATLAACSGETTSPRTNQTLPAVTPAQRPHLAFTVQPVTATADHAMDPVVVSLLDSSGNVVANAEDAITIYLADAPAGGQLSGMLVAPLAKGRAVFGDLHIDLTGGGYVLAAAARELDVAPAESQPIGIAWPAVAITGSCALTSAGDAWCWGSDRYGQLGNGTIIAADNLPPVRVSGGLKFTSLSQGMRHICAITAAGELWCWGNNSSGELGTGDNVLRTVPAPVAGGLVFTAVSAGDEATCGIVVGGAAYCWGYNHYGELGDSTDTLRMSPTPVAGGLRFASISIQRFHTCGVTVGDGAMWCWGNNDSGQLGTGDTLPRFSPVRVPASVPFAAVQVSWQFSCGLTANGRVYCWGFIPLVANVGAGGLDLQVPTMMALRDAAVALAAGSGTLCAANAAGRLLCLGFVGSGPAEFNSSILEDHFVTVGTGVPLSRFTAGPYPRGIGFDSTAWRFGYDAVNGPTAADTIVYTRTRIPLY